MRTLDVSENDCRVRPEHRTFHLVPPCVERADGTGPTVDLSWDRPNQLMITIAINYVTEHEKLAISIWGSANGKDWGDKPLLALPPKYYCGDYSTFLELAGHPDVRCLRVTWNMARCCKGDTAAPLFGFEVSAKECDDHPSTLTATGSW